MLLGPGPFWVRKDIVLPLLGRGQYNINSYTATKLSKMLTERGLGVVATAIPFYKINMYIAAGDIS